MTSQPRDKTRDSTKHDTAKFGIDLYQFPVQDLILLHLEAAGTAGLALFDRGQGSFRMHQGNSV